MRDGDYSDPSARGDLCALASDSDFSNMRDAGIPLALAV